VILREDAAKGLLAPPFVTDYIHLQAEAMSAAYTYDGTKARTVGSVEVLAS
jgi:hypothetical protein